MLYFSIFGVIIFIANPHMAVALSLVPNTSFIGHWDYIFSKSILVHEI